MKKIRTKKPECMPESLTSHGEPHARFQEVLQELAQARLDKKKKIEKIADFKKKLGKKNETKTRT